MITTELRNRISIGSDPAAMGARAASDIASVMRQLLEEQETVRMVFAAAPSQAAMLSSLASDPTIDWTRASAFHMDEYIGLADDARQKFGQWLRRHLFDRVPLGSISLIESSGSAEACAAEYARRLGEDEIDIVCLGIGVNGHIAFNDPPADFEDSMDVKVVELQRESRQQQVDEGLFAAMEDVPTHAITLTIPRLLRARRLFCCVPGRAKERAVTRALCGSVDAESPASILQLHSNCAIYLDQESATGLQECGFRSE